MEILVLFVASLWGPLDFGVLIRMVFLDVFDAAEKGNNHVFFSNCTAKFGKQGNKTNKWRFNPHYVSACICVFEAVRKRHIVIRSLIFCQSRCLVPFWRPLDFEWSQHRHLKKNQKIIGKRFPRRGFEQTWFFDYFVTQNGRPENGEKYVFAYACCKLRDLGGHEN